MRRRRCGCPLKRRRFPRVILRTLLPLEHAPEEIEEEDELSRERDDSRHRHEEDERVQGFKEEINLLAVLGKSRITTRHADDAHDVHRDKDRIDADKSYPEMYPAQTLAHKAPEHLRKPEIDAREHSEYRRDTHH